MHRLWCMILCALSPRTYFYFVTFLLNLKTTDLGGNLLLIRLIHRAVQCLFFNVLVHIYALPRHKWQSWDLISCFLLSLLLVHWRWSVITFIPNLHLFLQLDILLRFKCDVQLLPFCTCCLLLWELRINFLLLQNKDKNTFLWGLVFIKLFSHSAW